MRQWGLISSLVYRRRMGTMTHFNLFTGQRCRVIRTHHVMNPPSGESGRLCVVEYETGTNTAMREEDFLLIWRPLQIAEVRA